MGAHENPNRAAAYMCASIPFGLFGVRHSRGMLRIGFIAGVVILVAAIFATFSRSVAFPLAMIAAAVLIREVRSKKSYASLIVVVGLMAVFIPPVYWQRLFALRDAFETTTLDWSVYTRLLALRTAWEMFLDHPLTGVGIGNFITAAAYKVFVRIVVHNSYLEILVGTGVFGLFMFLVVLYSGFRHCLAGARVRWARQPAWVRSACFYCALSAVSIWISAFFGTMPFRQPFWVPIGAGLVIGNLLREDREPAPR
jgi:O-antigen ligase